MRTAVRVTAAQVQSIESLKLIFAVAPRLAGPLNKRHRTGGFAPAQTEQALLPYGRDRPCPVACKQRLRCAFVKQ
jgi:hypothetical protein